MELFNAAGRCLADPDHTVRRNGVQLVASGCSGVSKPLYATFTLPAGPIMSGYPGMCLDDYKGLTADGSRVDVWPCNGTAAQRWTIGAYGTLEIGGKCLTTTNGTAGEIAHLSKCGQDPHQKWLVQSDGTLLGTTFGSPSWELSAPHQLNVKPAWALLSSDPTYETSTWHVW